MQTEIVIFKELTTAEKIAEIEKQSEQYKGLVVDMNDAKERKKVKDSASVINDILKRLDRARIDKKKQYASQVEDEAAAIRERLEAANEPLTNLIEAHKEEQRKIREAEQARQNEIQAAFDKMNSIALDAMGQSSTVIEAIIDDLACFDFSPDVFQERTNEAISQHSDLMQKLEGMKAAKLAEEELQRRADEIERKEREQRAKEEAERQREERERIAQEAAEQARVEVEQRHKLELQQAEERREREAQEAKQREIEAERRAKEQAEAAVKAERERIEAEKRAEEEAELQREADRKHKGKIHSDIVAALVAGGISQDDAKKAVKLISSGKAGNVRIFY